LTEPFTIKGINLDLSIREKMININIVKKKEIDQSKNLMVYIIERNNDNNDADIVLQTKLAILILRDL
jgi:hypothetical protein